MNRKKQIVMIKTVGRHSLTSQKKRSRKKMIFNYNIVLTVLFYSTNEGPLKLELNEIKASLLSLSVFLFNESHWSKHLRAIPNCINKSLRLFDYLEELSYSYYDSIRNE